MPGVIRVNVDLKSEKASIVYDNLSISDSDLVYAINEMGFDASINILSSTPVINETTSLITVKGMTCMVRFFSC